MKKLIIASALLTLSTSAFATGDTQMQTTQMPAAGEAKEAKVQEIHKNTSSWMNKKVSLNGEVEKIAGSHAFVLDGEGISNDRILVIGEKMPEGAQTGQTGTASQTGGTEMPADTQATAPAGKEANGAFTFAEDDKVNLTGTIRKLTVDQIKREYAVELDPEIAAEYKGSIPVVITKLSDVKKSS